ncbi:uncharacterized protein LOC135330880 [Halichondria panicea]|uniref:uncharacterized protein LOC135330880 n=1 Tax=Halichondria panicea TaxID=6063 RepID=UPI00312B7048
MFKVEQISDGIPALNLPDVCTNSPIRNKAFCEEHCLLLQNEAPDVPIDLRQFLKYCGAQAVENEEECEGDTDTVDAVVNSIKVNTNQFGTSATTSQGTAALIEKHPELVQSTVYDDPNERVCRKDTGKSKRLRKWSRGHQFVIRGGGHIDTWQPLYRSESPSQVFLILIQWLLSLAKSRGGIGKPISLAYDNICNLAKLKAARAPLYIYI